MDGGAWARYGLVAVWHSTDPERNRDREYVLRWEPSLFGPALRANWGRADSAGPQQTWWPTDVPAALRLERRIIGRRRVHGYVCLLRGPAWPSDGCAGGGT